MASPHEPPATRPEGGALNGAISEAVVRLMAGVTGRGPTKARTTIDGNLIVVLVQNTLTHGERSLADAEHQREVLALRSAFQETMRADCITSVQTLTGRTVLAFMSANHIDPDLAAEIFVLEAETPASGGAPQRGGY